MSGPTRRRALAILGKLGLGAGSLAISSLASPAAAVQTARDIEIVAQRFQFTPHQIPISLGERVTLLIKAIDFPHGFNVPDLGIRADLVPGKITKLVIEPKELGALDFLCDNFCGDGHERMHGQFLVTR